MRALLLDFGGVLVDGPSRPGWPAELAQAVRALVDAPPTLGADLAAGLDAYGRWGDAMIRPWAPSELAHERFWADFVAADWPPRATWSRDVLCGRRAEVGCTVLMRSTRTDTDLAYPRPDPDLVVADPTELWERLVRSR